MPGSTRQATPGPSTLSSVTPTNSTSTNPKKRAGSDAADEVREAKKAKVDGEALPLSANNNNNKEKDKKKKKKKKKRRTSVVAGAPQPSLRDRETSKPRSSAVPPASVVSKPKSPDHANGHVKSESEGKQASSVCLYYFEREHLINSMAQSSDKGKDKVRSPSHSQRACTPPVETMQPVASGSGSATDETHASEIARLKAQLASQKTVWPFRSVACFFLLIYISSFLSDIKTTSLNTSKLSPARYALTSCTSHTPLLLAVIRPATDASSAGSQHPPTPKAPTQHQPKTTE